MDGTAVIIKIREQDVVKNQDKMVGVRTKVAASGREPVCRSLSRHKVRGL